MSTVGVNTAFVTILISTSVNFWQQLLANRQKDGERINAPM